MLMNSALESGMHLKANSPHAAAAGKSVIGFNIINGREIEGDLSLIQSKSAVDSRDLVGMFPDSGEKDVARAAKAAADAFKAWSGTPPSVRGAMIQRAAGILGTHKEKLARIVTREIGMTPREALGEVQEAIDACAFFASETGRLQGGTLPSGGATYRRPVGVCGVLATGSSPLAAPIRKILPAILCGNTVVWKPSDNAPTAAYLLLRAMMEAGLPPGVVNTVNGRGRAGCGKHFLAGIDKGHYQAFGFVGSTALGRIVGEMCGRNLILPSLDLVGKGSMVVMPDADLDRAAQEALHAAFGQAGQRPAGLVNLILHEACATAFRDRFLDGLARLEMGNPMSDPGVAFGPMINARSATDFREHWEIGRTDGAALLSGGEQWTEANRGGQVKGVIAHGVYMQPCVWDGVTPGMGLFHHQVLGPTVNLCIAKDFDEALDWANLTPARVSSGLYTQCHAWIERFKREIRTDVASLNRAELAPEARLPFAGFGTRPGSQLAIDGFTRWQALSEDASDAAQPAGLDTGAPGDSLKTDWASL